MVGWVLFGVACGIMFVATKSRGYPREARTKLIAFSGVACIVGLLLLYKSYNWVGTFAGDDETAIGEVGGTRPLGLTPSHVHVGEDPYFYGIIFDAGSTGSRVHAMKFASQGQGKPFKFIDVHFVQVKPGLSSFAKDPEKGAQSLVTLLQEAMRYIPKHLHKSTPMALKATAGLRLLPKEESTALLEAVRQLFKNYPFRVFDDSVEIMGGMDEGIFSWFTMNFFLEAMQNINNTMGVMDLGGGSTQVTFVPREKATLTTVSADYLTDIDILGRKHKLYTHSYLGLGLMSARLQILGGKEGDNGGKLESACFTSVTEQKWTHAGKDYMVNGLPPSADRFDTCYKASVNLLKGKIQHVREIEDDHFCTISYYYDMAVDYGLIDEEEFVRCERANWMLGSWAWKYCADKGHEGRNLTVQQYFDAAGKECQTPHPDHPFLCLDLSYMSALLHDGFGFRKDTKLMVIKRIHGREISWALGAMFNLFNTHAIRQS